MTAYVEWVLGASRPATALFMVEARGIILLLLGPQWTEAVPMFRILSIGAYASSFALVMNWLYLSENRTGELLRWSLISAPLSVLAAVEDSSASRQWQEIPS